MRLRHAVAYATAVLVVLAVVVAVQTVAPERASAATEINLDDRLYHPVSPARVLDTRTGPAAGPVFGGGTIDVKVTGVAGVPTDGVGAVVLNLTGTDVSAATFVTAYPTGEERPTASILNLSAGQTSPNLAILRPSSGGFITLYNSFGSVQLIADVLGWVAVGSAFTGSTPTRVLDTRISHGATGPVIGGQEVGLQLSGVAGLPASVGAVVLNLTGTEPTTPTFVTAYPSGEQRPTASNLNLVAGETRPNLVIAKVGSDGAIRLFNGGGSVHLVADVLGWFAVGSDYAGITPSRILDTRIGLGALGAVGAGASISVTLTGVGGVPSEAVGAVVLNLTGTEPTAPTFVTAFPDNEERPTASNLNLRAQQTAPNLVVAKLGDNGAIRLFNAGGAVHLIVDVVGWISTGVSGEVTTADDTAVIEPDQVTAIDPSSGDVTVTGPTPAVGDYLFVPPGGSAGDGILGQVTGVDGATVHTQPARLEDAFSSGEVHGSVDSRALAPGAPPGIRGSLGGSIADRDGAVRSVASVVGASCQGNPMSYDVDLSVQSRVVLDVRWGFGSLDELRVVFELEVSARVTLTVGGFASCEVGIGPKILLPPIWGFVPSLQPVMAAEFTGGLTITSEAYGGVRVGASYRNGSMEWIHEGYVSGSEPTPSVAGEMTGKVSFGPKASLKFADAVGASLFGGLFAETTISTSGDPWFRVDGGVEVSVSFEADLWFANFSYTLAALTVRRIQLAQSAGGWPGPKFVTTSLPPGEEGLPYQANLTLTGSPPLAVALVAGTLPAGLALNGTQITGTPTAAAFRRITLQVTDGQGRAVRREYIVNVIAPGASNVLPIPGSPPVTAFKLTNYYLGRLYGPGPHGEALMCAFEQTQQGLVRRAVFVARDGSRTPAPINTCFNFPRSEHFFGLTTDGDTAWAADGWTYILTVWDEFPHSPPVKAINAYGPDGSLQWTYPFPGQTKGIYLTPDRQQLIVVGEGGVVLDPHTGAVQLHLDQGWVWGYLAATDAYLLHRDSSLGINYVYRSTGQTAFASSGPYDLAVRAADETAVIAARVFDYGSGENTTAECGSDVQRWTPGGLAWSVTVAPAYASCSFQNLYADGEGGGYLIQRSGDRQQATISRIQPGGSLGFTRTESLAGGGFGTGNWNGDSGLGEEAIVADAVGRIAYAIESEYGCIRNGAPATCVRTRVIVVGADGIVLLTHMLQTNGYRVTERGFVGGFGQLMLTIDYAPADADPLSGPERTEVISIPVAFEGDWDVSRQYRTALAS